MGDSGTGPFRDFRIENGNSGCEPHMANARRFNPRLSIYMGLTMC